jgi:hypothetical protein
MSIVDPELLACMLKFGLIKPTTTMMEAYEIWGQIMRHEPLRLKRLEMKGNAHIGGLEEGIAALSFDELMTLRESLTGVLPFKK